MSAVAGLVGVAAFGLLGVVPAGVLVGARPRVLLLAPLVGGVLATAAGALTLLAGGTPTRWLLPLAVLAACAALLGLKWRPKGDERDASRTGEWLALGVVLLAAAVPLSALVRPEFGWDMRSIYMLHARMFTAGGDAYVDSFSNSVYGFSHMGYPPLVPSMTSTVWDMTGSVDYRAAQVMTSLLTACAVGLAGMAIASIGGAAVRRIVPLFFAGGFVLASFGVAGIHATIGYIDLLAAGCAIAALAYAAVLPRTSSNTATGVICAWASVGVKNDALPVACAVLLIVVLRWAWPLSTGRRLLGAGAAYGGLLLPVAAWPALVLLRGGSPTPVPAVSAPDPLLERFTQSFDGVATELGLRYALVAGGVAVLGFLFLRARRRDLGLGPSWWSWAIAAGFAATLVYTYTTGGFELDWWLSTSVNRATFMLRMVLFLEISVWGVLALTPGRGAGRPAGASAAAAVEDEVPRERVPSS